MNLLGTGWTSRQTYSAYGVHFALQSNTLDGIALARPYLPLGWQESKGNRVDIRYSLYFASNCESAGGECHQLFAGTDRIAKSCDSRQILHALAEHAQSAMLWHAKTALFVHAGVVGWRGRAMLIPGQSLSGKTTLVRALVQAGATYYSDEYAVLDKRGWVHPYALPLSIRSVNGHATKRAIEQLGGQRGVEPLPVGLIVITHFQRGSRWRPRELSPAQAMLALMDNTVAARREPEYTMPILREAALSAKTVQSKRGDAHRIMTKLLNELAV